MKRQRTAAAAVSAAELRTRRARRPYSGQSRAAVGDAACKYTSITVPIMGEGIRSAKIVALLKKPGDPIELDDALCEVETDKAVYPIESSFAGTMGEWKSKSELQWRLVRNWESILTEGAQTKRTVEAAVPAAKSAESGRHARTLQH